MRHLSVLLLFCLIIHPAKAQEIKVGAIFPLSGTVAPWGNRLRIGLETANDLQMNRFSIQYEDEGPCIGRNALSAYRKLRDRSDVKIIFLGCLSGAEAIAPVAAKDDVLLLSLGLLNDSTLKSGAKIIDFATEIGIEANILAEYVLRENPKKIAGLFFADAFGAEFSRVISEKLTARDKSFVALDDADAQLEAFQPLILRWKALGVDLLITSLSDRQQVTLYKEMRQLGFAPKIFSTYSLEAYAPPKAERVNFEGIKFTHPVNSSEESTDTQNFQKVLLKHEESGQTSNVNALFAKDGIHFLNEGISKCGGVKPTCLQRYFQNLGYQQGVSGEMRFEKSGGLVRPYGLKIVQNGEFKWLEKASLKDGG